MTVMNFDLEDGCPPVSFTLKEADVLRFMAFMRDCNEAINQPKFTSYGWGIVDKDGTPRGSLNSLLEELQENDLDRQARIFPDWVPYRVAELFYKGGVE